MGWNICRRGRLGALFGVIALSFSVVLASAGSAAALPQKFFGVGYTNGSESELQQAYLAGAKYYRYPVSTQQVELHGWGATEQVFAYARDRGIALVPVLQRGTGGGPADRAMPTAAELPAWGAFVEEAVERLGREGTFWGGAPNSLAPVAWEVWNEPNRGENGTAGIEADAESFTKVLKASHDAIAAVDPTATVLMGGLYWTVGSGWSEGKYNLSGNDFLTQVRGFEATLYGQSGLNFDGLSLHPYVFGEPEETKVARVGEAINEARGTLDSYSGGSGKGIWITEIGWPTEGPGWTKDTAPWAVSEAAQKSLLDDTFDLIESMQVSHRIEAALWYNMQDSTIDLWDQHCGLLNNTGGYKEARAAFLDHTRFVTQTFVTPGETVHGQPGYKSVSGNVYVTNFPEEPVTNLKVNVNFAKKEGGHWYYKSTAQVTAVNGHFDVTNWTLGAGQWRVKAVFFSQGRFKPSETNWHYFSVTPNGWHSNDNLGGYITAAPDISSQGSGRLDVFVRGADERSLFIKTLYGTWGEWVFMGGASHSGPSATSWSPGRIDLAYLEWDNSIGHWWWNGGSWAGDNLGGWLNSDPDLATWGVNRLDVFARGGGGHLYHKWYAGAWSGWENMGGSLAGGPGAVAWGPNRLDVVARMTDNSIGHWWWSGSEWIYDNLGCCFVSDPDIASWGSGRLDVFARGTDNALHHKYYSGAWSGWQSLGGYITSGPSAVSWGANRIDVVARDGNNAVTRWWFQG